MAFADIGIGTVLCLFYVSGIYSNSLCIKKAHYTEQNAKYSALFKPLVIFWLRQSDIVPRHSYIAPRSQ